MRPETPSRFTRVKYITVATNVLVYPLHSASIFASSFYFLLLVRLSKRRPPRASGFGFLLLLVKVPLCSCISTSSFSFLLRPRSYLFSILSSFLTLTKMSTTATATYDEVAKDAALFLDTLQALHRSLGTKFMVPTIGGKPLDLHFLFVEVTARGGLEKVIRNRQWKDIISIFSFPPTITNASFILRKYYLSLLHRYEQIYYFGVQEPTLDADVQAASAASQEEGANVIPLPASTEIWTGRLVTGSIDGKFENGYLVTVTFGNEKLKGILYHASADESLTFHHPLSSVTRRRNRKKSSWLATRDPCRPKPNRSGYNFFYSEHYARLKSLHGEQEKTISSRIATLWSKLTFAEKQIYQERGLKDKERYQSEMLEYRRTSNGLKAN